MSNKAFGVAAVVDGRIDVRTVSADAFNAKRLALFWVFDVHTTMETTESYVDFLWTSSVALMVGRNPGRSVELSNVAIEAVGGDVDAVPAPIAGETPAQRIKRLTPRSQGEPR